MNLALLSFEFPPAVAIGGIGTYSREAARMLAERGVRVEVFAAGREPGLETPMPGLRVHRVATTDRRAFPRALVPALLRSHTERPFDLIESPDIGPEGAEAFAALPGVARLVKLHTPSYLVARVGHEPPPLGERLRFLLGSLRRGRLDRLPARFRYDRAADPEYHAARQADVVIAPSRAIGEVVGRDWDLDPSRILTHPLPFRPASALLDLPPPESIRVVGFIGRLEARKGVVEIARAIPAILRQAPRLRFRFIGPTWPYRRSDMRSWIERHCARHLPSIDFSGPVEPALLPAEFARCDAMLLPSRWESFGYTCAESMAAARAVIGSAAGGMNDLIEPGRSGLLVPPRSPAAIAAAVLGLVRDPARARALAIEGRRHISGLLSPDAVFPLQMEGYRRALALAAARRAIPCDSAS